MHGGGVRGAHLTVEERVIPSLLSGLYSHLVEDIHLPLVALSISGRWLPHEGTNARSISASGNRKIDVAKCNQTRPAKPK